jgi:hypothetical protein
MATQTLTPLAFFGEAHREAFHRLKNRFTPNQDFVRGAHGMLALTESGRAKLLGLSAEQLRRVH